MIRKVLLEAGVVRCIICSRGLSGEKISEVEEVVVITAALLSLLLFVWPKVLIG